MPTQEHSNGVCPCQRAARLVRSHYRKTNIPASNGRQMEAGDPRDGVVPPKSPGTSAGTPGREETRLVARYGAPVLAAGHTAVPNLVRHHWRALGATYGDFYLYLVVMERKRTAEPPRLRTAEIARAMGTHERQVREHVARLQRLGLLLVRPAAGNRAAYDFSPLHTRVVALERQAHSAAVSAPCANAHGGKHPAAPEENAPYRRTVPKTSSPTSMPPAPIDRAQNSDPTRNGTASHGETEPANAHKARTVAQPASLGDAREALGSTPGTAGFPAGQRVPAGSRRSQGVRSTGQRSPMIQVRTPAAPPALSSTAQERDDDAQLVSLVGALSQEFGDPAVASNVTQARRHRHDAQMALADFVALLQEAARRTRDRRHRLANPMGYLFTVLRDLLFNETAISATPTRQYTRPARAPRCRRHGADVAEIANAYAPAHEQTCASTIAVADDLWRAVLGDLAETMTPGNFETWLRETVVVARDERRLVVGTPNAFARDWLSQRLHACVSRSLERLGHGDVAVDYVVCTPASAAPPEALAM